jgi:dehydrogenase/reductase SDR family protein 12
VVLAEKWSQFFGAGVSVYSMHPGWADTAGVRSSLPRFYRVTRRLLRTPEQGADTIVWLAVRQAPPAPSGAFWFDRQARAQHYLPWTREDPVAREMLWAECQRLATLGGTI